MAIVEQQLIAILGSGFLLGLYHALDADHVAAISAIVSKTKNVRKSSLFGIAWGIGHTLTLLVAGIIIFAIGMALPKKLALFFELLASIFLITLGTIALWQEIKKYQHTHSHMHGGITHSHPHIHHNQMHHHLHLPLLTGMVHGLAGSSVILLTLLAAVSSLTAVILYVLIFGIGSTLGMMLISGVIGFSLMKLARSEKISTLLRFSIGIVSIVIGFIIIYQHNLYSILS